MPKPKPDWKKSNNQGADDGCERVRNYLGMPGDSNPEKTETLTSWLQRLEGRVRAIEPKTSRPDDPPPKPPDLGG
jgi:hypothetical protein